MLERGFGSKYSAKKVNHQDHLQPVTLGVRPCSTVPAALALLRVLL